MGETALSSIRFNPSMAGHSELIAPSRIIFIPDRDPEPEMMYTLTVLKDAKDVHGLKTGEDFVTFFTADISYLSVLSFNADSAYSLVPDGSADLGSGNALTVPVNEAGGNIIGFTIRFSQTFTTEAKQDAAYRIRIEPWFPLTLQPISLRTVKWLSDDRMRMEWENFEYGSAQHEHYYKVLIPGGKGGVNNGAGDYFKEDNYLYLEAIK
jgi:hypothetical protein